jgi:hypothetical protein
MQVVFEEVSPHGFVEAVVEQDDRVAFFYLHGPPESGFGVRSCWVRNLKPAPADLDVRAMKSGVPPMLPRGQCAHPRGAARLQAKQLRVVWFEEGDAAALLEGSSVLAVIPSWSGSGGFDGYARDCVAQGPLCWPLPSESILHERVRASEAYWAAWEAGNALWVPVQEGQLAAYERVVGKHETY